MTSAARRFPITLTVSTGRKAATYTVISKVTVEAPRPETKGAAKAIVKAAGITLAPGQTVLVKDDRGYSFGLTPSDLR